MVYLLTAGGVEDVPMSRLMALPVLLALLNISAASAQAPGQIPGTLPPAYVPPAPPPPPPVAPAPVPSAVTPLPSPRYGVPPGVTSPVISGSAPTYRYRQPVKRPKHPRRRPPRTSEIVLVRTV
jgi:hypothetical protein